MTKVKICGVTNLEDALMSIDAGADALGFNFYRRSPRYISPDAVRQISGELPEEVAKVGVFVNERIEDIIDIASTASLTALQLHGDESTSYVEELRERCGLELIKAFRVSADFVSEETIGYNTEGILLDGFVAHARGGTGATFDWAIAKEVRQLAKRLWLAGGLSPENVRSAVMEVGPYAVDACSSLESKPGVKDPGKLRRFVMEAKAV